VLKWTNKRDVLFVSSEFNGDSVQVNLRGGKTASKPKMVVQYNTYMGGVDRADQLMTYYPLERKSLRWYFKVALHIFHIIHINSFILYNEYSEKKMSLKIFRISVIRTLILRNKKIQPPQPIAPTSTVHLPDYISNEGAKQKRCRNCYRKGIRKLVRTVCPSCTEVPGLCLSPCFKEFHSY
jgi:hypothetical protein